MRRQRLIGLICFSLCCLPLSAQHEFGEKSTHQCSVTASERVSGETGDSSTRGPSGFFPKPSDSITSADEKDFSTFSELPAVTPNQLKPDESSNMSDTRAYQAKPSEPAPTGASFQPLITRAMVKEAFT